MVDVMLTATARLLVSEGYARMTTNRVAEVAGVSIGSLYQYFPSKEALVGALIDRHRDEVWGVVARQVAQLEDAPLAVFIGAVARSMVAADTADPALARALLAQLPTTGRLARRSREAELRGWELLHRALLRRRDEVRPRNLDDALFAIIVASNALVRAALIERPELLETGQLGDLVADLLTSFLVKGDSAI